jgi:hypothetical protein
MIGAERIVDQTPPGLYNPVMLLIAPWKSSQNRYNCSLGLSSEEEEYMAEITNGRTGPGMLAVTIDVLRKEPELGLIGRNSIAMNSDLGLLWTKVAFWVGERETFSQEVLLHSLSLRSWPERIEALIKGRGVTQKETRNGHERVVEFDMASPELIIRVHQYAFREPEDGSSRRAKAPGTVRYIYDMLVIVDTGIDAGEDGVRGEGPAMYLQPELENLIAFARDLRSEAEMALLLDE